MFKGGTCIKKTYFETYRFSEDLDFSLLSDADYTVEGIRAAVVDLVRAVHDLSGIDFPEDLVDVRPRRNKEGQPTFQCRIAYHGPLGHPGPPRVLFDLTRHEPVIDEPSARPIYHPYPDGLPEDVAVLTYSFDELLAEKVRALYERSRPRDLYDVVYLLQNQPDVFDFARVRALFHGKCETKRLATPSAPQLVAIVRDAAELRSEWVNMLAHQLPALPGLDELLARLPALLEWIDEPATVPLAVRLPAVRVPATAGSLPAAGIRYWGSGPTIETLRFAGANHLMVEFDYHGRHRRAEPYSLRQAQTGNVLLYAWEEGAHIKAFNVAEIHDLRPTSHSFSPRYRVELSSVAPVRVPPARARRSSGWPTPRLGRSSRRRTRSGPTYVFQCPSCMMELRHSKDDPTLRRHKSRGGYGTCSGRRGHLVRME